MKSSTTTGFASAVLVLLCGSTVAFSLNGNYKTIIDTLAWTGDLSEVNNNNKKFKKPVAVTDCSDRVSCPCEPPRRSAKTGFRSAEN